MMKLPFSRKSKDDDMRRPTAVFAAYCHDELERMRDVGAVPDEERFRAAVELAMERLQAMEDEEQA